jgi:competence protein ComEC
MERFCFGVIVAALAALWLPMLPASCGVLALVAGLLFWFKQPVLCGVACFYCSLCLQFQQQQALSTQLLAQHTTEFAGTVVSIPRHYDAGSRFILQLDETVKGKPQLAAGTLLQINWPQAPVVLKQGQRWLLRLKLKAIRGLANPGTGQREAQSLVQGVLAQGTVVGSALNDSLMARREGLAAQSQPEQAIMTKPLRLMDEFVTDEHFGIEFFGGQYLGGHPDWRQQVYDRMSSQLQQLPTQPLLIALTVGERPFSDDLWLGLQATGLGHLISISGMHIALLFGWLMLLTPCWQRLLSAPLTAKIAASLLALAGAWAYSLLSGFAIPTIRALFALLVAVLLQLALHRYSGRQFCLLLTALLLLWQPLWLLSLSFWLTVSAVALVFYLQWRYPAAYLPDQPWHRQLKPQLWHFLRYQWLFCWLMLPFGLLLFQGVAPLALLSNLLFVPWCSLLAIPLLLLVFVLEQITWQPLDHLWQLLDWLYQPLWWWLHQAAAAGWWWSVPQQDTFAAMLVLIATALILLPHRRVALLLACWLMLPLALQQGQAVSPKMHLIDVGQGTAVLLQEGSHGILYDLGPRYGSFSITQSQVLPYLRYAGIRQLDFVILSHDDSDHTGDPALIKRAYPEVKLVSDSRRFAPALNCRQLPGQWHSFQLQWLWPPADQHQRSKNDSSCVLLVKQQQQTVLLSGDIGQQVEKMLLQLYPNLRADILLLAHHGSNSSTALAWLAQLQPKVVLNSSGAGNPYQHPARAVTARLELLQIPLLDTAKLGALQLQFLPSGVEIDSFRLRRQVKWLENLPVDAETAETTR